MTDFWRNLTGDELLLNLHGEPPYSVRQVSRVVVENLGEMPSGGRVLEVGSGDCRLLDVVQNRAPFRANGEQGHHAKVVGIDVNHECARFCHGRVFLCDGTGTIQWGDNFFDGAYSVTVFQHLPEDVQRRYLAELARVVKPGGRIVIQHVVGDERGPQSRQTSIPEWHEWACEANLRMVGHEQDQSNPDWTWFVMEVPA